MNSNKVLTKKLAGEKYFILTDNEIIDIDIAKELGLTIEEYQNTLISYGGYLECGNKNDEIVFSDIDKINKAVEWVESILIARKLGVNNGVESSKI